MKVIIDHTAEIDLAMIEDDLVERRPQAATKVIGNIRKIAASLSTLPLRWPKALDFDGETVRRAISGKYLIFYTVDPHEIHVMRIVHGARDLRALFRPKPAG